MAIFDAGKLLLVGLVEMALPARASSPARTVRLCDGGFVEFGGFRYESRDAEFGSIESVEPIALGTGDEAPAFRMTFGPASAAAAAALSHPAMQGAPIKFWKVRVIEATGVVSESKLLAVALLDTTTLRVGRGTRTLEMECVSENERLFSRNRGNALSPRFHKSVWPGELGLDNATGAIVTDAWGVEGPPRATTSAGSGVGGGYGGRSGGEVVNYD